MAIDTSVDSESDLKTLTRSLTQYSDTNISPTDLDNLVRVAAMRVETKAGSDAWFSDDELGKALLFTTCILTKASVENYSVNSWEIGDETIEVENASESESVQLSEWASAVADAIEESEETTGGYVPSNTANFIGG